MAEEKRDMFTWIAIALIVILAAMAIIGSLVMMRVDYTFGMMGRGFGLGLFMIVPAVIVVVILILVLGWPEEKTVPINLMTQPSQNPLDILNRRLASGEISPDDYERIRARLSQ